MGSPAGLWQEYACPQHELPGPAEARVRLPAA